jgi:t-SNARE complex subunit (syntaxin)
VPEMKYKFYYALQSDTGEGSRRTLRIIHRSAGKKQLVNYIIIIIIIIIIVVNIFVDVQ